MSNYEVPGGILNNVWPNVPGLESRDGSTRYRCLYVLNAHATITLSNAIIWISLPTLSPHDEVDIGLGTTAAGTGSETFYSTDLHPTGNPQNHGVAFSHPTSYETGLALGTIAPGHRKAFWVRKILQSGAAAYDTNQYGVRVRGETS